MFSGKGGGEGGKKVMFYMHIFIVLFLCLFRYDLLMLMNQY